MGLDESQKKSRRFAHLDPYLKSIVSVARPLEGLKLG